MSFFVLACVEAEQAHGTDDEHCHIRSSGTTTTTATATTATNANFRGRSGEDI